MRILLIDNYDSFTYNLMHLIGAEGPSVTVARNDAMTLDDIEMQGFDAIVISPGPCTPTDAGICIDVLKTFGAKVPIFGVCLGMQAMGEAYGGRVVRAPNCMHGKTSPISHTNEGIFAGLPQNLEVARYHSLIVERSTLPDCLSVSAHTPDDHLIMGLSHKMHPVHGVQFHPESIASQGGQAIIRNFLTIAQKYQQKSHSSH